MTKFRGALIAIAVVVLAVGCAKPPQAEIDSAKAALEAARAEASEYAPEAFSAAEDAMSNLETELKAQEEKFALMRRYETSKQLAASATDAANTAAQQAAAEKQRLQQQANDLIAQAKTLDHRGPGPGRLGAQGQGIGRPTSPPSRRTWRRRRAPWPRPRPRLPPASTRMRWPRPRASSRACRA